MNVIEEKIEILPVTLLDQHRQLVKDLRTLAHSLHLDFGWHYLLDLTWIIKQIDKMKYQHILDAGAGTGILQWYLAQQGAVVISVDRTTRANLPQRFRSRYRVRGLRSRDLASASQVRHDRWHSSLKLRAKMSSQVRDLLSAAETHRATGQVVIYNQDLKDLKDLEDNSIDAVVSVSALEHNDPQDLPLVVTELMRVLKPGGVLLATLGAARDTDWFHTPSSGWCYTANSLRRLFSLDADVPSNYDRYDELFLALRQCKELSDNLAPFYRHSGNNGMPWGKWDPQYQTVGIIKRKA